MATNTVPQCTVYWLYDATCSVPENDGYVGITTKELAHRLAEHRYRRRFPWTDVRVLFIDTIEECIAKEMGYRPTTGIGWNVNSGGNSGKQISRVVAEKIGRSQRGRTLPESQRVAMRAAAARRSPEEKARLADMYAAKSRGNKSRTGMTTSPETRAKMRAGHARQSPEEKARLSIIRAESARGHTVSEEGRKAISEAVKKRMKGKRLRLGAKLTAEQRANISRGRRGKALGNQNWRKRKSVTGEE